MDKYIKKEEAIRALLNDAPEQVGYSREDAADCIRYMDVADVAPVVHGQWINAYPDIEPNPLFMYGICSNCGFEQSLSDKLNYCPNCGTKMDEGKV